MTCEKLRTKNEDEAALILEAFLSRYEKPTRLEDVIPLLEVSAKLVETAAYSAAGMVDKTIVVDIILIAAQLEAKATKFRGLSPV